jgi:hypothetical protein
MRARGLAQVVEDDVVYAGIDALVIARRRRGTPRDGGRGAKLLHEIVIDTAGYGEAASFDALLARLRATKAR